MKIQREKHGNLNGKFREDKRLVVFHTKIGHARKNPGRAGIMRLNQERIASLAAV